MRAACLFFAVALVSGCGSDEETVAPPVDSGGDRTVDAAVHDAGPEEATPEATVPDANGDVREAATEAEADVPEADVAMVDVAPESSREAGPDAPDVLACVGGTVDCNGDGTCVDLSSSAAHCGKCGHSCLGGACLARQCQPFPVATGMRSPMGVVPVGNDVYATDFVGDNGAPTSGALIRIGADGTQTIVESGLGYPASLWFDKTTDSFIIPNYFGQVVVSRPLHVDAGAGADGGAVTTIVSNHLSHPLGVASNADWLFIVNAGNIFPDTEQTIQRRPRSDLTQYAIFPELPGYPIHIDLDANYVYWTEFVSGLVVRMPLNADVDAGAGATEVITSGLSMPRGNAADGAMIYFSLWGDSLIDGGPVFGSVWRVENRPGATAERLATLPGVLEDVAVDALAIYVAGRGSGTVWKIAK